jgi:UDP-N-acetylmuramyl pentapeptide phosphotransferase/UDP-N-acetylglucosamine-1-phosphate transferase
MDAQWAGVLVSRLAQPVTYIPALVALALSLLLQPVAIRELRRRGVLDLPNHRSSHTIPTPRGGGVVVVVSILVGLSLLWGTSDVAALATVVAISAVLGFREDLSGVTVRRRVLVQGVAALVLVVCAWPMCFLLVFWRDSRGRSRTGCRLSR